MHHNSFTVRLQLVLCDLQSNPRVTSWYQCHHILKKDRGREFQEEDFCHRCQELNMGKMFVYTDTLLEILHFQKSSKPGIKRHKTLSEHRFGDVYRDIHVDNTTKIVILKSVRKTSQVVVTRPEDRSSRPVVSGSTKLKLVETMMVYDGSIIAFFW